MRPCCPALLALALLPAIACARTEAPADDRERVEAATLTFVPGRCAGVLVGDSRHALTAAHCILPDTEEEKIRLADGTEVGARVLVIDRDQDLALLELEREVDAVPLEVAAELPTEGASVLFFGRPDRAIESQQVIVERLGPCPSLPAVPRALFTTLHGEPGDSGAPVVDLELRVVGLVHGGAACSIATPTAPFAPLVQLLGAGMPVPR